MTAPSRMMKKYLQFFFLRIQWCMLLQNQVSGEEACRNPSSCEDLCTEMSCQNGQRTEVPSNLPLTTTVLDLSYNKFTNIELDSFCYLTKLEKVDLSENQLQYIGAGTSCYHTSFLEMNLAFNQLRNLSQNTFDTFGNLRYLSLSNNQLTTLPRGIFRNLPSLQTLDISRNQLIKFSSELFGNNVSGLQQMETILLQGNHLTYLDEDTFPGLLNLTSLYLFRNKIRSLADNTFLRTNVEYIYLFGNSLSTLSTGAFRNGHIKEIHLYGNKIQDVTWMASERFNSNAKLYLSCNFLGEVNASNINLNCVHDDFVPHLTVKRRVAETLREEGFKCPSTGSQAIVNCKPCKKGTYAKVVNYGVCVPCPAGGFYQDDIGAFPNKADKVGCKLCNKGTYAEEDGASEIGMCKVCPDGTDKNSYAGFRACRCLDNYARTDRLGKCTICLEDGVDCSSDYKTIKYGFFWSWNFSNAKVNEYEELLKELQLEFPTFRYYGSNYTFEMPKPYKCPRYDSCNNTKGAVEVTCATGYKGWLCGTCSKSFYEVMGNCIQCPNTVYLGIEICVILCILIMLYFAITRQFKKKTSCVRNNTESTFDIVISRSKIVLGFYQVVGEYLESFHQVTCAPFLIVGEFISLIQMNILKIFVKPQCFNEKFVINPKVEFIIGGAFTFLLLFIALLIYVIKKQCYKFTKDYRRNSQRMAFYLLRLKSKILYYVLILMFVTYPPICTAIFQLYPQSCETFALDEKQNHNITVLRADYEIHCKDIRTYQICAYILTGGYVVAFPAILYILLRKYATKASSLQCCTSMSSPVNSDQEHGLEPLLADSSDEVNHSIWLDFLCENYKPQYWYWEIVELARKVTQTALITLLGFQDKVTVLLTISISIVFLVLHARLMPMKSKFEQRLQMFALIAILINLQVAMIETPLNKCDDALSIALTVLNVAVIFVTLAEAAIGTFRLLKGINYRRILTNVVIRINNKLRRAA